MEDVILWAGVEFAMAGWMIHKIQKEKTDALGSDEPTEIYRSVGPLLKSQTLQQGLLIQLNHTQYPLLIEAKRQPRLQFYFREGRDRLTI